MKGIRGIVYRWVSVVAALVLLPTLTVVRAASFNPHDAATLIANIATANGNGADNTITLDAGVTYTLTAVNNGDPAAATANGLPVLSGTHTLTIVGNGATIARSAAGGTPSFRFFQINSGATLVLNNLTLANGLALGADGTAGTVGTDGASGSSGNVSGGAGSNGGPGGVGVSAQGGAILNNGTLTVADGIFRNNGAQGSAGGVGGAGGQGGNGIFFGGSAGNGGAGGNAFASGAGGNGGSA
ncbi:MAG: hypothetical protein M3Z19_16630, partial [Chloroflexota bacterium]|nr:hypothetical protein [Chloroflexota bacterium]